MNACNTSKLRIGINYRKTDRTGTIERVGSFIITIYLTLTFVTYKWITNNLFNTLIVENNYFI